MVIVLATGPKVRGFKPAEDDGFLKPKKIRSTNSFGGEVNPSDQYRKMIHTDRQNSAATSRSASPRFATRCSAPTRAEKSVG
jgi:hypothetical protein